MIEYLLLAVRDHLRSNMTVPGGEDRAPFFIGLQPGGHPPARMGEWYVSIDESNVISTEKESLREVHSVEINITKRAGKYASDTADKAYLENMNGLRAIERQVIQLVHNNHTLRALANTLGGLPGETIGDIFQQPLWYTGRGRTRFEGGEWIGADGDHAFLVRTLNFTGAARVQAPDVMT